jgi:hypothetical protein
MSEYQIKLEAIEEYMNAVRFKKLNEELCTSLLGLLGQLNRHYEKNGMKVPDEVKRLMAKTSQALDERLGAAELAPSVKRKDSLEI